MWANDFFIRRSGFAAVGMLKRQTRKIKHFYRKFVMLCSVAKFAALLNAACQLNFYHQSHEAASASTITPSAN
jgi:hypothetical protein